MPRKPNRARPKHHRHNRWLLLIAFYKFLHALLFFAIGLGALRLLHKDVGDLLSDLADHLRFNPESHLLNFILDKASLLNDPILRRIGFVAFSYAAITLAEGIGLYLQESLGRVPHPRHHRFLPALELFEVLRRITWIRVGLLTINILVFLYLLRLVLDRARLRVRAGLL